MQGKVVVVEDEGLVALELEDRMHALGLTVCGIADTAEAAIALVALHEPDLVLMDVRLRGSADGFDAAAEIRARSRATAVIFVTAYADEDTMARLTRAEPDGFILEPFDERALIGNVVGALARRDADKRHLAESASRERSEHTRAELFAHVPEPILAFDERARLVAINGAASALLGYGPDDAPGLPLSTIILVDGPRVAPTPLDVHARGERLQVRRRSGETFVADCEPFPAEVDGQPVVCVRLRAGALDPAAVKIARLAALELGPTLEAIVALAGERAATLEPDHPAALDMTKIAREASLGRTLVDVIGPLARPAAPTREVADVDMVLRACRDELATMAGESIHIDVATPEPSVLARIDAEGLRRVLRALVGNARRALPAGGSVQLSVTTLEAHAADARERGFAPGNYALISSRDDPATLAPSEISQVFGSGAAAGAAGIGALWLAEAAGVLRAHGGGLELESGPRHTTLRAYLPAA